MAWKRSTVRTRPGPPIPTNQKALRGRPLKTAGYLSQTDRIVVDASVLAGKPVVSGTRISVEFVLELLAGGWTHAQILIFHRRLPAGRGVVLFRLVPESPEEAAVVALALAAAPFLFLADFAGNDE